MKLKNLELTYHERIDINFYILLRYFQKFSYVFGSKLYISSSDSEYIKFVSSIDELYPKQFNIINMHELIRHYHADDTIKILHNKIKIDLEIDMSLGIESGAIKGTIMYEYKTVLEYLKNIEYIWTKKSVFKKHKKLIDIFLKYHEV
jgi:hypothetical protein